MSAMNLFVSAECCHTAKKQDEKSSCCEAEKPERQEMPACDMFEMNSSSFDNCGCIHSDQKINDEYTLNNNENLKVIPSSAVLFIPSIVKPKIFIAKKFLFNPTQNEPIFITNSAFLI